MLIVEGFEIRNITAQVYESNPYSTGATSPHNNALKVTFCGLSLSVDDSAVLKMLHFFDVTIKSDLKNENNRQSTTHRKTSVLNRNRFI